MTGSLWVSAYWNSMLSSFHHLAIWCKNSHMVIALIRISAVENQITFLGVRKVDLCAAAILVLIASIVCKRYALCLKQRILGQTTTVISNHVGVIIPRRRTAYSVCRSVIVTSTPRVL
jgi:hypothetical protein